MTMTRRRRDSLRRYNASQKGYICRARYTASKKGRATRARWYAKNRKRLSTQSQKYHVKNRARCLATQRRYAASQRGQQIHAESVWRWLGIVDMTWEKFVALIAAQDGRCAICRGLSKGRRLDLDHNHATGLPRGALCQRCNYVVYLYEHGYKAISELVAKIEAYLQLHSR